MNRSHLSDVLRAAIGRRGYAVYSGSDDRTEHSAACSPAAWLPPMKLLSSEGRTHGTAVYEATLRLLRHGHRMDPGTEHAERCRMEQQLVDIFTDLSKDARVIAVERLCVRPDPHMRTDGAVTMTAGAQIVTHF